MNGRFSRANGTHEKVVFNSPSQTYRHFWILHSRHICACNKYELLTWCFSFRNKKVRDVHKSCKTRSQLLKNPFLYFCLANAGFPSPVCLLTQAAYRCITSNMHRTSPPCVRPGSPPGLNFFSKPVPASALLWWRHAASSRRHIICCVARPRFGFARLVDAYMHLQGHFATHLLICPLFELHRFSTESSIDFAY